MRKTTVEPQEVLVINDEVQWKRQDLDKFQISMMLDYMENRGFLGHSRVVEIKDFPESKHAGRNEKLLVLKNVASDETHTFSSFWFEKVVS
jgi:hypothetical protein